MFSGDSDDHLLLTMFAAELKSCSHGTDVMVDSPLIVISFKLKY